MTNAGITNKFDMTPGSFNYNPFDVVFENDKARVAKLRPTENQILVATFRETSNLDISKGDNLTTLLGGSVYSDLSLVGDGELGGGLQFDSTNAAFLSRKGSIRLKYIPSYDGLPGVTSYLIGQSDIEGSNNSRFTVTHSNAGYVHVYGASENGTTILDLRVNSFNPMSGTEYLIEANWDLDQGIKNILIDGVLLQLDNNYSNSTLEQGVPGYTIIGGSNHSNQSRCFGAIRDVEFFNDVQNVATYSPLTSSIKIYPKNVSFSLRKAVGLDQVINFSAIADDNTKFIIEVDLELRYFTGADWIKSDGTIDQANTVEEILQGFQFMNITAGTVFGIKIFLQTNEVKTSSIESFTVVYNFYDEVDAVDTCILYGDVSNLLEQGAKAVVKIEGEPFIIGEKIIFPGGEYPIETSGKFRLKLICTESISHVLDISIIQKIEGQRETPSYKLTGVLIPDRLTSTLEALPKPQA